MNYNLEISNSTAIFGKDECTYQCVIDDFKNAKFIGIMTFNISLSTNSRLLASLKDACLHGSNAVIITNIPKRFPSYYAPKWAIAAKDMIDLYMRQLNPQEYGMRLSPYFAFSNHTKIVMTENIVYWGSGNFSDESSRNFECGTISTDKDLIAYLRNSLFPEVQSKSAPYYKYYYAIAISNIESLIPACERARRKLFDASFMPWSDYDTNFEEKWIYRTTDSGLTEKFLGGFIRFFSHFDDALSVIDDIVNEYSEYDELPEQVEILKGLYDEYTSTYETFYENISSLFEDLKEVARYDVSDEACRTIANDFGMEAYDENLDYYAEIAMNEASCDYEQLIKDSKQTIIDALDSLNNMIHYSKQLNDKLYEALEINPEIDNTVLS